VKPTLDQI